MNTPAKGSAIVLHIPHASTVIPDGVRAGLLLDDDQLGRELRRATDWYTDELYCGLLTSPNLKAVVYPVSRLVTDPERFPDDAREPMARHGLGAVYLRTLDGTPLRRPPAPGERNALFDAYYQPHHQRLLEATQDRLEATGECLVIDCHSFPDRPFTFEEPTDRPRPDICLGTDAFHTPDRLVRDLEQWFRVENGLSVDVNHPFAGALVPLPFYRGEPRVRAIMIEINRRLYMDESTGQRTPGFGGCRRLLAGAISRLADSRR